SKDKVSTLLGKKYCQGEESRLDIIAFEEISVAHTKESKKEAKCIAWKKAVFERYRNLSLGRVLGLWENEKENFLSTLKNLQVIPFSISSLFSENNQFKLKIDDIVTELYDLEEQKIQWEQEQDQSKSFEEFIEKKARSFLASYEVHPSDSQHFSCLGEKTTSSLELFRQMWKIQENLYRKTGDKLIINPESTPQIEISNSAYILKIEVGNCQYSGSEPASH
ncbi:MAG: hypothetical protein KBD63_04995, partial [Bacteriovoracaceae bacterium]|nr:hypothetical protein [Bacteriovoracaceae bacterium]